MSESDADFIHDSTREYKLMTTSAGASALSMVGTISVILFIILNKKV